MSSAAVVIGALRVKAFKFKSFCLEIRFEFYDPVNTVKVMLSWSVNLLTLFLGRLHPLMVNQHFFDITPPVFVCVEVLQPSQPNGVMSSGQFT